MPSFLHTLCGALMLLLPLILSICSPADADASMYDRILEKSNDMHEWLVHTRRALHQIPEKGSHETLTSKFIRRELEKLNMKYTAGYGVTGVVGQIGKGEPVIALRADMDALPIQEPEGFEARSQHEGMMHACGHDAHVTMLLGAAKLLKEQFADDIKGTVKFVFQPDEEGGAGGDVIIKAGAIDGVQAAFGVHVMPHIPSGTVATRPGTIMAGALSFAINITGRGGHAALPHLNVDPVVAASSIISSLQTLVSRETSPLDSAVFSVTLLRAGDAYNVIPDSVLFGGTIRALSPQHLMFLQSRINEAVPDLAKGFGCTSIVDWRLEEQPLYPPTVNDPAMAEFHTRVAQNLFGEDHVSVAEPLMAGEDFSFFCQKVPCSFSFLGIRNETCGSVHNLHNPKFTLDENVLSRGAALHAATAIQYLLQAEKAAMKDEL